MQQERPPIRQLIAFFATLSIPVGIMVVGTILGHDRVVVTGYLLTVGVFLAMGLFFRQTKLP